MTVELQPGIFSRGAEMRVGRRFLSFILALLAWLPSGCRAQQTPAWPQWEQYTRNFMDDRGRIVDHTAGDRTTSEGQAYAMFFALVADDKNRFQKLLNWTEDNLAGGDLSTRLPAWNWGKSPDGSWKALDPNPASDADLWMAYTLLEAGRLWHDSRYEKLGRQMASQIARQEVALIPGIGASLLPAPQGFHPDSAKWVLNSSYLPLPVLTYFAKFVPDGPWGEVLGSLRPILVQGAGSGFVMDWVTVSGGVVRPSINPTQLATGKFDGIMPVGAYEAIRVYLWLGISDPATPNLREMLGGTKGMAAYLTTHAAPPGEVDATGKILNTDAPPGFSAAFIPYLSAISLEPLAKVQEERLLASKDAATGLFGRDAAYYDQNLALFALGWKEQRYRFDRDGRLKVHW